MGNIPTGSTSESAEAGPFSNHPLAHYNPACLGPPKTLHKQYSLSTHYVYNLFLRKLKDFVSLLRCGHKTYLFNINPTQNIANMENMLLTTTSFQKEMLSKFWISSSAILFSTVCTSYLLK